MNEQVFHPSQVQEFSCLNRLSSMDRVSILDLIGKTLLGYFGADVVKVITAVMLWG